MSPADEGRDLKKVMADFICDTLLPGMVADQVTRELESNVDQTIMAQAITGAQDKVRLIIEQIPKFTSQAFLLRIPGMEFLVFVLMSEYILLNSVNGEKGALRYANQTKERGDQTLARCLNRLGFHRANDLEPYRRQIEGRGEDGPAMYQRMINSLKQYPKEK